MLSCSENEIKPFEKGSIEMFKLIENEKVKEKLAYICHRFRIPGELIIYRRIPTGHINTA